MRFDLRITLIAGILFFALWCSLDAHKLRVSAVDVGGSNVREFRNRVFEFSEDIIVEGNATLVVENATIRFVQTSAYKFGIKLQNASNGNPRLIARNATFESTKPFKVSLYGNSSAVFEGLQFRQYLELFDSSRVEISDNCLLYYVRAYGSSEVKAIGSDVYYLYAYNESHSDISTCAINRIETYDSSALRVSISTVKYSVAAYDLSEVSISYSSFSGDVSSEGASKILFNQSALTGLKADLAGQSKITFGGCNMLPTPYPSACSTKDSSILLILNCTFNDCSLSIDENSTVAIEGSNLTSTYLYSFQDASIGFVESSIDWLLECQGESRMVAVNSSFTVASGRDASSLGLDSCMISELRASDASSVVVSNSVVKKALMEFNSVNATLNEIKPGFFGSQLFPSGLNVTFLETAVDGWSLRFLGSSNVSLRDCALINLGTHDSSEIWALNTTYYNINSRDLSEVYRSSYLTLRVVDYLGNPVEGANVTVSAQGVPAESKLTQENGTALFELFEGTVNPSGSHPIGDYEIDIVSGDYSPSSSVNLNGGKSLVIALPPPWWYWYAIIGLIAVVIAILCVSVFILLKRRKKPKT